MVVLVFDVDEPGVVAVPVFDVDELGVEVALRARGRFRSRGRAGDALAAREALREYQSF